MTTSHRVGTGYPRRNSSRLIGVLDDGDTSEGMDVLSDPARWPFCEERARAAAAVVAFPEPTPIGGRPYRWRKP